LQEKPHFCGFSSYFDKFVLTLFLINGKLIMYNRVLRQNASATIKKKEIARDE
jgi:hypothetical protein